MITGEKIFSSIPGQGDPQLFLGMQQKQLIHCLRTHLKKFSETIRVDLSLLLEKVDSIDVERRFSPLIYSMCARIQKAYSLKDLESLFHLFQYFKNQNDASLYADELTFSSFLSESWEEFIISELKKAIPSGDEKKHLFPLIHWKSQDFPPLELQTALEYLQDLDEDLYNEFTVYTSRFKFFASSKLVACTSTDFFGAIYIKPVNKEQEPIAYYLDCITHEVSHLHLYAMMSQDPMILNDPKELFSSPLRPDPRPMYGVFHAAFVLARIVRILRRYKQHGGNIDNLLAQKEASFHETCKVVLQNAQMTNLGKELYQTLESCAFQN